MLTDEQILSMNTFLRYMASHGFPDDFADTTPETAPVTLISPFVSGGRYERFITIRDSHLMDLLEEFGERECYVPRDRIFSLLSLCKQDERVAVDYKLPDVDLLYEVLKSSAVPICLCHALIIGRCLGIHEPTHSRRIHIAEPYMEYDFEPLNHKVLSNDESSSAQSCHQRTSGAVTGIQEVCFALGCHLRLDRATVTLPIEGTTVLPAPCLNSGSVTVRIELWALPYAQAERSKRCHKMETCSRSEWRLQKTRMRPNFRVGRCG